MINPTQDQLSSCMPVLFDAGGCRMKIIKGKCENPDPDRLYVIFRRPQKDYKYTTGIVIRGGDANWISTEIVGYVELPIKMEETEFSSWRRDGEFPLCYN